MQVGGWCPKSLFFHSQGIGGESFPFSPVELCRTLSLLSYYCRIFIIFLSYFYRIIVIFIALFLHFYCLKQSFSCLKQFFLHLQSIDKAFKTKDSSFETINSLSLHFICFFISYLCHIICILIALFYHYFVRIELACQVESLSYRQNWTL